MKTISLVLITLLINYNFLFAQAGILDSTFGTNGVSAKPFPLGGGSSVLIDKNKNIVVCGVNSSSTTSVARFKTNGSLDSTFGTNGKVVTPVGTGTNTGYGGMVIQTDGKIAVGGICSKDGKRSFQLIRYNPNGTLDNTFNGNGIVITSFNNIGGGDYGEALTIQADGKIIEAGTGWSDEGVRGFALARFNSNGSLDNTFGLNGKVLTQTVNLSPSATCVSVQKDGKILAGGYSWGASYESPFTLLRYNQNGSLDNNFGTGGRVITYFGVGGSGGDNYENSEVYGMALQDDGKIILTGHSYVQPNTNIPIALVRYNTDGSLDSSFGIDGKVRTFSDSSNFNYLANAVTMQPDLKIIVVGQASYNPAGYNSDLFLARYKSDGSLDSSFGNNGIVITSIDSLSEVANSVTIQPDGKIVVAGISEDSGMIVLRYLSGLNVGIIDFSLKENPLLIYPNPIQSQAVLQYSLTQDEKLSIVLYDMLGRQMQAFITNETKTQGEHKEVLQFSSALTAGNYILNISNGKSNQSVKIVKQK